jgi:hypothetical protein
LLSDDRKHHGRKRHILLITATIGCNNNELLNPCFRFVMALEAVLGDSNGNLKLNVEELIGYLLLTTPALHGRNAFSINVWAWLGSQSGF